jgi:hypothetical protein
MMKTVASRLARTGAVLVCAALATGVHAETKAKKAAAKPAATLADLSSEQIATAGRVLTGNIACEFNQSVDVQPHAKSQGYFNISFKGQTYVMAPEATTTGAVRLEDKKAGTMWLQIGNKSMLMNSKKGQRMVDNCKHPSQQS